MPHPADFPSICVSLQENSCQKPMTVPGIGPAISTAMVAAIGKREAFQRGRDFRCPARLDPSTILDWRQTDPRAPVETRQQGLDILSLVTRRLNDVAENRTYRSGENVKLTHVSG